MKYTFLLFFCFMAITCTDKKREQPMHKAEKVHKMKLITLDPGHFHAALAQKTMYASVDSTIYVYAPEGPEVADFLNKIAQYNGRADNPTGWKVVTKLSDSYLEDMIAQKPGNVMVVAGKNSKKVDYILAAVKAGLHVYADKPLVIDAQGFVKLKEAFKIAQEKNVMIYDIMTERFEATTMMQKLLSGLPEVFGGLVNGSIAEPAISKESVHHFFKNVSGKPLVRPAWFFDVDEEGEGIVDVTTHLVDLVQWEAFPGQTIDSSSIKMIAAKRWPTTLSLAEFSKATGLQAYPGYLMKDVTGDVLNVYANGEMNYTINGKYAKVSVVWNFAAPEGAGDTHYSIMRGTKCDLVIKQGAEENYSPTLYIVPKADGFTNAALQSALANEVAQQFPGTTAVRRDDGSWAIAIPQKFKIGHEDHFAQVTQNYLRYLQEGQLPSWEVPNMITKYYTTIEALKMAKQH